MTIPFEGFQQGLMTGAQLGGRMRQNQQARQIGGLMASGDYQGAATQAFQGGDLQTGAALQGQVSQQQTQQRQGQIVGALKTGDYAGAQSFASTPEELAQISKFRETATEAERAQATQRAEGMAAVVGSILSLPEQQRLAAAQQYAPQFGLDPAQITPDMLTPQALEALRVRALGLKDYLNYQQEERAAQRPIIGNGFISLPPGSPVPQGGAGQSLGSSLPPGWTPQPRPNQPSSAPAAGGGERNQPVSVSFRSSQEAQAAIQSLVPGVRVTSGRRSQADNKRVGGASGSFHLQDRARDLVPPPGMSMAQLAAKMRSEGFRALNEGDHIHVSW